MEPSDPIIDLDTGALVPVGTDIAIDGPGQRGSIQPTGGAPSASPWKVIAVIAGIVAAASLVFSVFGSSDRIAERALPALTPVPTPTTPVFDGDELADPNEDGPDTFAIPVVSEGISRAGERCGVRSLDIEVDAGAIVRFAVPDGLSVLECRRFATDPVSARSGLRLPLDVVIVPTELGNLISRLAAERAPTSTEWHPVDGRRGWMMAFAEDGVQASPGVSLMSGASRVLAVELPNATLLATWGGVDGSPLAPSELDRAFGQLVASIEIDVGSGDRFHHYRDPGGWCSGDDYVTRVPDGWFASPNCRWLNTSSESPIVLQCNCLPPVFLQRLTIPFDADFGFTMIESDAVEVRPDGTPVRVIEGLWPDANNQERPIRMVIVDGGDARIAVVASRFTEHALPGHTYAQSLAAQEFVLDHLRFHSGDECGVGQRWIADSADRHIDLRLGSDETVEVPSGAAMVGTGCSQRESSELEVRLEADPHLIGWVDAVDVRSPVVTQCPSADGVFEPNRWTAGATGDFDGDGREDTLYVRTFDDSGVVAAGEPTAVVLYANGGLAEGSPEDPDSRAPSPKAVLATRRIPGIGHDLIEARTLDGGRQSYELLDVSECSFGIVGWASLENGPEARSGVCAVSTPVGQALRVWAESFDPHQGFVREADELWNARDGRLVFTQSWWEAEPPCGPRLRELQLVAVPGGRGAPLAGVHPLSLQWASSRDGSRGAIDFHPLGDGRYKVDGRHVAPPGEQLELIGVIEVLDADTLAFDGTITTVVERLNGGDPCVRDAGQLFIRRPGTDVFRLQDRINCDGARTDWIDITLTQPVIAEP